MTQQKTIKCLVCGKAWPAVKPTDLYHTHPSVTHASTGHDDWRSA